MKRIQNRLGSLCMAVVMLLSMAVTPAMAADTQDPPTTPPTVEQAWSFDNYKYALDFTYLNYKWVEKISKIEIDGKEWTKVPSPYSIKDETYQVLSSDGKIRFGDGFASSEVLCKIIADGYKPLSLKIDTDKKTATIVQDTPAEYTVTAATDIEGGTVTATPTSAKAGDTVTVTATPADGYELDTITVTGASGVVTVNADNTFTMPAENVTVSATFKAAPPVGDKEISLSQVKLSQDSFGWDWYVTFGEVGYVSKVSKVTVNGTEWAAKDYSVSSGGAYKKDTDANRLVFAVKDFSPSPVIDVLKSGDVITITAEGYKDLTFKLVIDTNGNASIVEDDGQGIKPEVLPEMFEGKIHSEEDGEEYDAKRNMGIGLSVCKSIITAHKGGVKAENMSAGGARVMFWLPMEEDETDGD